MINLHESMGLGWDKTRAQWIFSLTLYQLCYGVRCPGMILQENKQRQTAYVCIDYIYNHTKLVIYLR